jgi:hypothetical protein
VTIFNWFIFFVDPTLLVLAVLRDMIGIIFVEKKKHFDILFNTFFGAYKISKHERAKIIYIF